MERWSRPHVCAQYDRLQPYSYEVATRQEALFTRPSLLWEQDCEKSGMAPSISLACQMMMKGWDWAEVCHFLAIWDVHAWSQHFYSSTGWLPQEWQKTLWKFVI